MSIVMCVSGCILCDPSFTHIWHRLSLPGMAVLLHSHSFHGPRLPLFFVYLPLPGLQTQCPTQGRLYFALVMPACAHGAPSHPQNNYFVAICHPKTATKKHYPSKILFSRPCLQPLTPQTPNQYLREGGTSSGHLSNAFISPKRHNPAYSNSNFPPP